MNWKHLDEAPLDTYVLLARESGVMGTEVDYFTGMLHSYDGIWRDVHGDDVRDSGSEPRAWAPLPEANLSQFRDAREAIGEKNLRQALVLAASKLGTSSVHFVCRDAASVERYKQLALHILQEARLEVKWSTDSSIDVMCTGRRIYFWAERQPLDADDSDVFYEEKAD